MPASEFIKELRRKVGNDLLQIPTVSVLIFDEEERALLVRHIEGDLWTTPGGMIEPYETPPDAALREAWEETGLRVKLKRIISVFGGPDCTTTYENGDQVSWISTVFEAAILDGEPRPDHEETLEVRYFSETDLQEVECTAHVHDFLRVAWARRPDAYFQPPGWAGPHKA